MTTYLSRVLFFALALGLLSAILGGLARLGLAPPGFPAVLLAHHGALMCAVLFPGVIGLERAVAIGQPWAWCTPCAALASLAGVAIWGPAAYPLTMLTAACLGLQHYFLWRRRPGLDSVLTAMATLALAGADLAWGRGIAPGLCALGWASFLILIISAERLEFSFLSTSKNRLLPALVVGLGLALLSREPRLIGLSWVGLSSWLVVHDLARRNAKRDGLAAYAARAVLMGYGWLALSGLDLALHGLPFLAGPSLDRVLHGVFVGFVLSMVMAHGPIVFPALWKSPMAFSGWFYGPLALLHLSLAVRWLGYRPLGPALNVLALVLFALTMALHRRAGHNPFLRHREASAGEGSSPV